MFSKILVKLIDQSITPAVLLVSTRIISIILYSKSHSIYFNFDSKGFSFRNFNDYVAVNSYSSLFMLAALTIGLTYILVKAYVFHSSHISPKLTADVFSMKLNGLIQSSYDLYTQGSIWLSYLFFMTLACGLMAYFSMLYLWIFYVAMIVCVVMTVLFIIDVENELKIGTTNPYRQEEEE